jgi:hypothetical protein
MISLQFTNRSLFGSLEFTILKDGRPIGQLIVVEIPPNTLAVEAVGTFAGPLSLGPAGVRELIRAVKDEFPYVKKVIGRRVSGARRFQDSPVVEANI